MHVTLKLRSFDGKKPSRYAINIKYAKDNAESAESAGRVAAALRETTKQFKIEFPEVDVFLKPSAQSPDQGWYHPFSGTLRDLAWEALKTIVGDERAIVIGASPARSLEKCHHTYPMLSPNDEGMMARHAASRSGTSCACAFPLTCGMCAPTAPVKVVMLDVPVPEDAIRMYAEFYGVPVYHSFPVYNNGPGSYFLGEHTVSMVDGNTNCIRVEVQDTAERRTVYEHTNLKYRYDDVIFDYESYRVGIFRPKKFHVEKPLTNQREFERLKPGAALEFARTPDLGVVYTCMLSRYGETYAKAGEEGYKLLYVDVEREVQALAAARRHLRESAPVHRTYDLGEARVVAEDYSAVTPSLLERWAIRFGVKEPLVKWGFGHAAVRYSALTVAFFLSLACLTFLCFLQWACQTLLSSLLLFPKTSLLQLAVCATLCAIQRSRKLLVRPLGPS